MTTWTRGSIFRFLRDAFAADATEFEFLRDAFGSQAPINTLIDCTRHNMGDARLNFGSSIQHSETDMKNIVSYCREKKTFRAGKSSGAVSAVNDRE